MTTSRYFDTMLTLFDERSKSEVELKDFVDPRSSSSHVFTIPECSVRSKFDFGIGNGNQGPILISVSESELFFPKPKPKLFFHNNSKTNLISDILSHFVG